MSYKLTPWYPANTRPVRVGVYNASIYFNDEIYRYWNGEWWGDWASGFPIECVSLQDKKCPVQDLAWRGLAEKP